MNVTQPTKTIGQNLLFNSNRRSHKVYMEHERYRKRYFRDINNSINDTDYLVSIANDSPARKYYNQTPPHKIMKLPEVDITPELMDDFKTCSFTPKRKLKYWTGGETTPFPEYDKWMIKRTNAHRDEIMTARAMKNRLGIYRPKKIPKYDNAEYDDFERKYDENNVSMQNRTGSYAYVKNNRPDASPRGEYYNEYEINDLESPRTYTQESTYEEDYQHFDDEETGQEEDVAQEEEEEIETQLQGNETQQQQEKDAQQQEEIQQQQEKDAQQQEEIQQQQEKDAQQEEDTQQQQEDAQQQQEDAQQQQEDAQQEGMQSAGIQNDNNNVDDQNKETQKENDRLEQIDVSERCIHIGDSNENENKFESMGEHEDNEETDIDDAFDETTQNNDDLAKQCLIQAESDGDEIVAIDNNTSENIEIVEKQANCGNSPDGSGDFVIEIDNSDYLAYCSHKYHQKISSIVSIPKEEFNEFKQYGFGWIYINAFMEYNVMNQIIEFLHSINFKVMVNFVEGINSCKADGFMFSKIVSQNNREELPDKVLISPVESLYADYFFNDAPIRSLRNGNCEGFFNSLKEGGIEKQRRIVRYMESQGLSFNQRSSRTAAAMILTLPGMRMIGFRDLPLLDKIKIVLGKKAIQHGTFEYVNFSAEGKMCSWKYTNGDEHILIAANFDKGMTTGHIVCNDCPDPVVQGDKVQFIDILTETTYLRYPHEMRNNGLCVILYEYEAQIFQY